MYWLWMIILALVALMFYVVRDDRWMSYIWRYRFRPGDRITIYRRNHFGVWQNEMTLGVWKVHPETQSLVLDDNMATRISMRWLFSQVFQKDRRLVIEHEDANGVQISYMFERWHPFIS